MATMRAGQWDGDNGKVVIRDIPIPSPAEGQFLVKIHGASLCHSDLHSGMRPKGLVTMGHEGVGHIHEIHPSAGNKGFKIGDAVGFSFYIGACHSCEGCTIHNRRCENGQPRLQGVVADGFFAEYAVTDWQNCVRLPEKLEIDRASPLFCAGVTAFNAVQKCGLKAGDWLAVVGCGGLGQYATQYAKAQRIKVVGLDISDDVLESVSQLGADVVFNTRTQTDYFEELRKAADGKGVHAAAVFSAAVPAFDSAKQVLRLGGTLMVVGIATQPLNFLCGELCTGLYRIDAASSGVPENLGKAVDFSAEHNIQPAVEFRKLEDLPKMYDEMHAGKAKYRQVIRF